MSQVRTPPRKNALDGLVVLRAVVEAGSFVRAAEALRLTQPAVSRAIGRLEERVGVRMFQRSARSIALTEDGRRFYQSVAPHLQAIEDATNEAEAGVGQVRGYLHVNVDPGVGQFVLAPRLGPLLARYPNLSVELTARERLGDLVREGFDVAVRFGHPEPSGLKARLLLRSQIVTCASPAFVKKHGNPRSPRDLEALPCILMRDPSSGTPFGWEFQRGKKTVAANVSGRIIVNAGGAMMQACLAGQGVAQLLELYVRDYIASGQLVQLLPDWADESYPLYVYHHQAPLISAKVRAFIDFVVAATR